MPKKNITVSNSTVGIGTMAGSNGVFSLPPNISTGHIYTTNSTNTLIGTTDTGNSAITIDGGTNGKMSVNVPLLVNGRDVMQEIDEMRDALLLLKRHVDMEAKYPRLKELKDAYDKELKKCTMWDSLK